MSNSNIENVMNGTSQEKEIVNNDDDRGNESDESISTEELNLLQKQVGETFKPDPEPEPEKQIEKKEEVIEEVKTKPKKL